MCRRRTSYDSDESSKGDGKGREVEEVEEGEEPVIGATGEPLGSPLEPIEVVA